MEIATCLAPVNIAVIKYWGKANEELIIPLNDSLSGTLSTNHICAKTTILASPHLTENKFWLNGKEEGFSNKRLKNCLEELQKRADPSLPVLKWKIAICSENNFPTAAGLASSAAGYAALVYCLAKLYQIKGDISSIARRGSGSACRSIYGGFVEWCKGVEADGSDSIAKQIVPASYWPEMRVLILVVNDSRKKYSSSVGMKTTVETSELIQTRVNKVVPKKMEAMKKAIKEKDFNTFAKLTIQDSNQMHAVVLDSFPPCTYMNDISNEIAAVIHAYNDFKGTNKVAYTFDAGPNACLYLLKSEVDEILSIFNYIFPRSNPCDVNYFKGIPITAQPISEKTKSALNLKQNGLDTLKYIISTKIGEGPKILEDPKEHLLNDKGVPKNLQ